MRLGKTVFATIGSLSVIFAIVLMATTGHAQRLLPADPHMVVVPVRSAQDIATDLDNAMVTRQLAISRNSQAVERLSQIAGAIASRESSVDDIKDRKDDARDDNRKADEKSLKIEEKASKQAIDLLKRLRGLREAEVDVAKAEEDHADRLIRVLQLENEMQQKRAENSWPLMTGGGDLTQNTAYQVLNKLEVNLLELQKELASATQKVASKQKDVVDQRMKLHKAQFELGL